MMVKPFYAESIGFSGRSDIRCKKGLQESCVIDYKNTPQIELEKPLLKAFVRGDFQGFCEQGGARAIKRGEI